MIFWEKLFKGVGASYFYLNRYQIFEYNKKTTSIITHTSKTNFFRTIFFKLKTFHTPYSTAVQKPLIFNLYWVDLFRACFSLIFGIYGAFWTVKITLRFFQLKILIK